VQYAKFGHLINKTHSVTLHRQDGEIGFFVLKWGDQFSFSDPVGHYPWEFIAQSDRARVKGFFFEVAHGLARGVCRYFLEPAQVGVNDHWICETAWYPSPGRDFPVIGVSESWNAVVESLSRRERQVAKLLPTYTLKEISVALHLTVSTVDKIRHRIGEKVDLIGPALVAWCQSHGDVL
jgi:hypothetical protein